MELRRKKNVATEVWAPMITTASPETFITGATVADTAYYKDGAGAWTSLAITDTFTEIATTGVYELSLTAGEMNHDFIMIKMTATSAANSAIIIYTTDADVDDLVRSTTPANTLDVSATGEAGIDWANVGSPSTAQNLSATTVNLVNTVTTLTGHTAQTGDSYGIVNSGTFGNAQLVRSTVPANTLDVSATGEAGVDWANVGGQATAVTLTNTTVGTVTANTDMRGTDNALLAASAPANFSDLAITLTTGRVDVNVNNDKTGYSISGTKQTLDALNDITTAQVNTEVLDVMNTDTFAEPGQETPAATNTLVAKIGYLFKLMRNKIETTSTQISIYDDAGTVIDQKSTISDAAGTYTRGEFGSGP